MYTVCRLGAETSQCDSRGVCRCKPGVTGDKCDRCLPNHFELGPEGCRSRFPISDATTRIRIVYDKWGDLFTQFERSEFIYRRTHIQAMKKPPPIMQLKNYNICDC